MRRNLRDPRAAGWVWQVALLASLGLHTAGIGACSWWLFHGGVWARKGSPEALVEVAFEGEAPLRRPRTGPRKAERTSADPAEESVAFTERARAREPRPDTGQPGRGGTDLTRVQALNLSDTIDGVTLDRDVFDSLHAGQLSRARTGSLRRSLDDRTSDPEPTELGFISHADRRLLFGQPRARHEFGRPGDPASQRSEPQAPADDGPAASSPAAVGASERSGVRPRAAVTMARPWVTPGRAATPSARVGPPADSVASAQRVASLVQSLVHASSPGGRPGDGPGGQNGPGPSGIGGPAGPGSQSRAQGGGRGPGIGQDLATIPYFRDMQKKLEQYSRDAFPQWAIARGLGGLATIGLVVLRDGRVAEARVVRPSGIPEYDRNVLDAVRRAAPYGPLPPELSARPLAMQMSFDATNPAVGRDGPGPGQRRPMP